MTDDRAPHFPLLQTLADAALGAVWAAVLIYALVLVSWLVFTIGGRPLTEIFGGMWGVSDEFLGMVWFGALALAKLIALTFVAIAFGLWMWRRRLASRLAGGVAG